MFIKKNITEYYVWRKKVMVKIKDVAERAQVSPATVSNVLNGRSNVGEETRQRVLEICKELDYQPNLSGKSLKTGDNHTILFNFSDFDREFYLKIIQGISDYAYSKDYALLICTSKGSEKYMNKTFTSGCIMLEGKCSNSLLMRKSAEKYPMIILDRVIEAPYLKSLVIDNYSAQRELMEELIRAGYRKFAYISGVDGEDTQQRYRAFRDALDEHQIEFKRENYFSGDYREKSGYRIAKLLMLSENLPDILVCANDNMAIGAIKAFRAEGIRVPEDISVCGFDDTEAAKMLELTTVTIPNYERGYLAAQYLLENIDGAENYDTFRISAKVKWRKTTVRKAIDG
jgi:LacI family transcriptional regulator